MRGAKRHDGIEHRSGGARRRCWRCGPARAAPIDTGEGFGGTGSGFSGGAGGLRARLGVGPVDRRHAAGQLDLGHRAVRGRPDHAEPDRRSATIDQQVGWLQTNTGGRIEIEGHADERGTEQYNIQLGARRAAAVRDYMVSRGIPDSRIGTNTFGRARPVATCADESCWSQNRRAVTVVSGPGV